jgi:hypothetical protein
MMDEHDRAMRTVRYVRHRANHMSHLVVVVLIDVRGKLAQRVEDDEIEFALLDEIL